MTRGNDSVRIRHIVDSAREAVGFAKGRGLVEGPSAS